MAAPRPARALGPDALLIHREWIERVARALVLGDADADDLGQQVWADVLARPPAKQPVHVRSWLRSVLRFKTIDAGRAARTRARHEEAAARPEQIDADPADVVARAETLERVAHAVLELEEPYRTTVLLRWFEDLPPREIARRQGVPVETVRTRLKRAVAQLRGRLDAENHGDRRAWCLALLPLLRSPKVGTAAGGTAASTAAGVLVMTLKTKVAAAALALLLLVGAVSFLPDAYRSTPVLDAARTPDAGDAPRARSRRAVPSAATAPEAAAAAGSLELLARDWASRPVSDASAEVRLRADRVYGERNDATAIAPVARARTGSDGRARFDGLTLLEDLEVVVSAAGRGRATRQFVVTDAALPVRVEVTLLSECRLTGRVLDTRGDPVPGAVVDVYESSEVRTARMPTDAAGRYAISGLPRGPVSVMAARAGDAPAYSSMEARAVSARVRLPFERIFDLVLRPSARITGTVRDFVTKAPIAGAEIRMFANSGVGLAGGPTTTAADGSYLITNLCDCVVDEIQVRAAGYAGSPRRSVTPARFVVRSGEAVTHDIELDPAPGGDTKTSTAGGVVEGRVLTTDGSPIPGARVGSVLAGPDGSFRIEGAPPGREATWVVSAAGWAGAELVAVPPPAGEILRRDVTLLKAPRLVGTITLAEGGAPPEGTTVRVSIKVGSGADPVGKPARFLWTNATPGPDGRYSCELPWAGPGRFWVTAQAPGLAVANSVPADLDPGVSELRVDLALRSGASVSGRVVDARSDAPVSGAQVVVIDEVVATTGPDGRFEVGGLAPTATNFDAMVVARGYARFSTPPRDGWVPGGQNLVRLQPLLTISGRVTWQDGTAVVGAVVSKERSGDRGSQQTASDGDGGFVLSELPDGRHRLRVEHPSAQVVVLDDVAAGSQGVAVVLRPGASISGRVVDAEGRGVPTAGIFCKPAGREAPVYRVWTGSDGAFTLDGLELDALFDMNVVPPAKPSNDFPEPDRYIHTSVLDVKAGSSDLTVRLKEGPAIEGVLVDETGRPLSGVALTATYAPGRWSRTATTDAQGRFRFRGLQQVAYQVTPAAVPGGPVEVRGGDAVPAGASDLRLVGIAGATLAGLVVDEQGRAIRDAAVEVASSGGARTGRTDRSGEFVERDLRREPSIVHISVAGLVPLTMRDVTPGGAPMRITLARGLEVFGRLLKADGTPLRARLDFRHPDPEARLLRQTWTDDAGRFRVSGFMDVPYEVIVVAGPRLIVELGPVTPGTGVEVELKLP